MAAAHKACGEIEPSAGATGERSVAETGVEILRSGNYLNCTPFRSIPIWTGGGWKASLQRKKLHVKAF